MLRGILVRIFVLVALPLALARPFIGLCIYLWYSHFRLNDFVWPDYSFNQGAFLLAITTIVGYVAFEMKRSPLRLQGMKLLVLFWLWIALATVFATDPNLAYPKLSQYTHIFVIAFLIAAMANSEERIRKLLYVIAFAVGVLGSKGCFDFLITGGQYRMRGPGGLMTEENEYALALNMAIPILFLLARTQPRKWLRLMLYGMAAASAVTVIGTRSRSGFLGLAAAALLLTFYSKRKVLGIASLAVMAVLFFLLTPQASLVRYESITTAAQTDPSAIGRLQAWSAAMRMTEAHPVLGVGPLNFLTEFPHYSPFPARAPHNAFMALLAESGIPSCLIFTAMILAAIGQMWWLRRKLQRYPGTEQLAIYCLILQLTLTVYIIPNLFINRQNQDLMYHLLGLSAGLAMVVKHKIAGLRRTELRPIQWQGEYAPSPEPANA